MKSTTLNRLGQGVWLKALTTAFEVLVGVIVSVLLNRVYGKDTYGLFVLVYAVTGFAFAVSDFGAKLTLVRFVPLRIRQLETTAAVALCGTALLVQLVGIVVTGGLLLLASRAIAVGVYGNLELLPLIRIGILYFAAFALFDFFVKVFQALQDWRHEAFLTVVFGVLRVISVVIVGIVLGEDITRVLVGNAVAGVLAAGLAITWLPKDVRRSVLRPWQPSWRADVKTIVRFGLPLSLQRLYGFGISWFDKILLGRFITPSELATYYIASMILNGVMSLFKVLPVIFTPYVSALSTSDVGAVKCNFEIIFRWLLQAVVVAALLVLATVEPVVIWVYGASYAPVVPLAYALTVVFVLRACRDPFTLFQTNVFGRIKTAMSVSAVLAGSTILSTLILVPLYGVWGAIVAAVVSHAVTWAAFLYLSPEFLPMIPVETIRATGAALAVAVGVHTVAALGLGYSIGPGLGLVVLYVAGFVMFRGVLVDDVRIAGELLVASRDLLTGARQRGV